CASSYSSYGLDSW
nr:immunoglobulin heavy chain junction region [Macaca mulatta]